MNIILNKFANIYVFHVSWRATKTGQKGNWEKLLDTLLTAIKPWNFTRFSLCFYLGRGELFPTDSYCPYNFYILPRLLLQFFFKRRKHRNSHLFLKSLYMTQTLCFLSLFVKTIFNIVQIILIKFVFIHFVAWTSKMVCLVHLNRLKNSKSCRNFYLMGTLCQYSIVLTIMLHINQFIRSWDIVLITT